MLLRLVCESFGDELQQDLSALKDVATRKIITPVIAKKNKNKNKGKRANTKAKREIGGLCVYVSPFTASSVSLQLPLSGASLFLFH